jgi:hypothetical protein
MLRAQWARTVLVIERSLPPSTRLRGQAAYSHNMADGRKALVLKKVFSVSYHLQYSSCELACIVSSTIVSSPV